MPSDVASNPEPGNSEADASAEKVRMDRVLVEYLTSPARVMQATLLSYRFLSRTILPVFAILYLISPSTSLSLVAHSARGSGLVTISTLLLPTLSTCWA